MADFINALCVALTYVGMTVMFITVLVIIGYNCYVLYKDIVKKIKKGDHK